MSWQTVTGNTTLTQGQFFSVEIQFSTVPGFGPDLNDLQSAFDGMGDAEAGTTILQPTALNNLGAGTGYWDLIYSGQISGNGGLHAGQFIADLLSICQIYSSTVSVGQLQNLNVGPIQVSATGGAVTGADSVLGSLGIMGQSSDTSGQKPFFSTQTAVVFVAVAILAIIAFGFSREVGL